LHSIQSYCTGALLQFAVRTSGTPVVGVAVLGVIVQIGSVPEVPPQATLMLTGAAGACAFDE
jgi:hypothetical protein